MRAVNNDHEGVKEQIPRLLPASHPMPPDPPPGG
jgi:hypothetical protein